MSIEFSCQQCGKVLKTSDDKAGKTARCPGCQAEIQVPFAAGTPAADEYTFTPAAPPPPPPMGRTPEPTSEGTGGASRRCPMCGENIKAAATVCRFCGERLDPQGHAPARPGEIVPSTIDAGDVFNTSWSIFKENMGMTIGATLIMGGINFLINLICGLPAQIMQIMLENGNLPQDMMPVFFIVNIGGSITGSILGVFLTLGLTIFMLKTARGQHPGLGEIFSGGPYFLRGVGFQFLLGILVFIGVLACIIPGIGVGILLAPGLYYLVDRNCGPIDAIKGTFELTWPNLGHMILVALIGFGLGIAGCMACGIGIIFAGPLIALMQAVTYLKLTGQQTA